MRPGQQFVKPLFLLLLILLVGAYRSAGRLNLIESSQEEIGGEVSDSLLNTEASSCPLSSLTPSSN